MAVRNKTASKLFLSVAEPQAVLTEEERSRAPSVFTVLRAIVQLFFSKQDSALGLYGAFGYDLCFQFDPIKYSLKRPDDQRDLVLFLPDEILVVDHFNAKAWTDRYEFELGGKIDRRIEARDEGDAVQADRIQFRGAATICRANMRSW